MFLLRNFAQRDGQVLAMSLTGQAASVLDIGYGIGEYLKYTNDRQRVVAIEPHRTTLPPEATDRESTS